MLGSLWFNSFSAGGGGAAGDYELISTTVLGSSASSVTFSGLGTSAAAYKHLQIRMTVQEATTTGSTDMQMRFNGDSASNYSWHILYGNGSSVSSISGTSQTWLGVGNTPYSNATNQFGGAIMEILDFSSTSKNKTTRSFYGSQGNSTVGIWSGAWYSTAAVTSIVLTNQSGANFSIGSRFSLYGLK